MAEGDACYVRDGAWPKPLDAPAEMPVSIGPCNCGHPLCEGCKTGAAITVAKLTEEAYVERAKDGRRTETLIQHPETGEFLRGALVEAAYQREAWPDQDAAKSDSDWFWTLGYIVGKAIKGDDDQARLHHIEAGAALLANWHNAVKGRIA